MRIVPFSTSARILTVCLCALAAACSGGGGGSPTTPGTNAAPSISTANTSIFIGQTVQFAASGGGTIRWGGDNPAVATVDQTTGRVTGVGNGRVTIWAENETGRTTRLLRGMPSFAGTWQGTYEITGCAAAGGFVDLAFCGNFPAGSMLTTQMQLSQTDDRVTGSINFGISDPGTVHASIVSEDGTLPLTATVVIDIVTVAIGNTRLQSPSPGAMTGSFEQVWTAAGLPGAGTLFSELRSFTRVAGGPAFGLIAPRSEPQSIDEVIRRVLQRR